MVVAVLERVVVEGVEVLEVVVVVVVVVEGVEMGTQCGQRGCLV